MSGILLAVSIATAATASCASPAVHDGDTFRCGSERIRIAGIDAPELPGSPRCEQRRVETGWCDYQKANAARDALRALFSRGAVIIERLGTDRYGRTLANVRVRGIDAGEYLIAEGLARRWR